METLKAFFSNSKKTVAIALIMNILAIISVYFVYRFYSIGIRLMACLENAGILIYFIIISFRLYQKKGNVKVANCILILYFIVRTLFLLINVFKISSITFFDSIFIFIIPIIVHVISSLYFCKILFRINIPFINNMIFTTALLIYVTNILISNFTIYSIILALSYLSTIPYFYNYYELLERSYKNDK